MDISRVIKKLLEEPSGSAEYICGGTKMSEVYGMAGWLHKELCQNISTDLVCLATEDKAVIAAAILSSLAGGPALLLPYALSSGALARAAASTGFSHAISDEKSQLPENITALNPREKTDECKLVPTKLDPERELLRIFTGGSTGAPQSWSKSAGNIISEAHFLSEKHEFSGKDRIVPTIPPYHIYGLLFTVAIPLVSGAAVTSETPSFPGDIAEICRKYSATVLVSVPTHYRLLNEHSLDLRLSFSSAGMLEEKDNSSFCHKNDCGIIEVYGSTETGGIATRNRSQGEEFFSPFSTIDWKIENNRLAVRSPYISKDLPLDNEGFFLAGDRVSRRSSTSFSLEGRADSVVKIAGKRVDLEEIRLSIKKVKAVEDCVVLALPEKGGRGNLICAILQGEKVDLDMVKEQLLSTFESYAQPRRLLKIHRIPMKENGKYDIPAITRIADNG